MNESFFTALVKDMALKLNEVNSLTFTNSIECAMKAAESKREYVYQGGAASLPQGFDPPDTFEKYEEAWKKRRKEGGLA